MNPHPPVPPSAEDRRRIAPRRAGFTLIELIGVLAIIAILASVLAPNAIKSLDRAAVRAEVTNLQSLNEQVKLYLRSTGSPPAVGTWTTALATYSDLSPADLLTNRRNMARVYLLDPAATPAPRAIILSSMRSGLALPPAASINTAARFQEIWQTPDGSVPPTSSWAGWSAWAGVANSGEYLVISRVNLLPVYHTDLQTFTVTLNNRGTGTISYNLVSATGVYQPAINVAAGGTAILSGLRPRERIYLYRAAGGVTLDYAYIVSDTGMTFDFDGTKWIPR
jgi:prepilin-type N-terminal cleavage/methylation domain-containing protein